MAQESKVNCSINYNIGHVKLGHMKRFNYKSFQFKLLRWFGKNKRRLPWRIPNVDPYRIFVVEIMLQQTQIKPGDFNQALMELGAIICVPENPRCAICPVRQLCKAYQCGKELNVPVKSRNVAIKEIKMAAAILQNGGRLLVRKRPNHGIWGGLWELPSVIRQKGESAEDAIQQEFKLAYGMQVEIEKKLPVLRHQLTHRTLWIEPVVVHMSSPRPPNIHQNTRRTRCAVWRELANPPSCWAEKREYRRMDLPLTLSLRERVREKAKNLQSARWGDQKTLVLLSFPVHHQKLIREYIS